MQYTDFPRKEILVRDGKGEKDRIIDVVIFSKKIDGVLDGQQWADTAFRRIRSNIVGLYESSLLFQ
ncbi:MAG TPA: hypothetical protein DD706_06405 [Nitrospiraceae bacterium]|nr:hypothetical protein [Nitrospiraceae bacterium]